MELHALAALLISQALTTCVLIALFKTACSALKTPVAHNAQTVFLSPHKMEAIPASNAATLTVTIAQLPMFAQDATPASLS